MFFLAYIRGVVSHPFGIRRFHNRRFFQFLFCMDVIFQLSCLLERFMRNDLIKPFFLLRFFPVLVFLFILYPNPAFAQINSVYFLEVTNSTGDEIAINNNLLRDNPFNKIRGKLFINSWLTNEIGVFVKFLYDEGHQDKIRLDGAYFLFDLKPAIKFKAGKIPFNVGGFPMRNYLEKNPLIGSPLLYQYRSAIRTNKIVTLEELLYYRGKRRGVNIIYESCWDNGIEFFGEHAKVEYSFAVTNASVFNPKADSNGGKQIIGRIGIRPVVGLRAGLGYARAPYMNGEAGLYGSDSAENIPEGKTLRDYTGELLIADFEYTAGHLEFFAEWARTWFKTGPTLQKLSSTGYFIEGKYTITPRWYAAGRFGQMLFEEVENSQGFSEPWDYDITRLEVGLGFKLSRKMTVKGVGQFNWFSDAPLDDIKFVTLQLKAEL